MTSVGDVLRSAREQQGRTLAEVAEALCLTHGYVRAMETDDVKNLPGVFFYKSFVWQYAGLLGVDRALIEPGVLLLAPKEESTAPTDNRKPKPLFPLDPVVEYTNRFYFSEHRMGWSVGGLAVALALCSGFYAWWSRAPQSGVPATAPAATVTTQSSRPAAIEPANISTASDVVPVSGAATENSPAEEATADGVQPVVLSLSATERTWLRITSNGRTIFSGILQASESRVLKGSDMATMKVGNAAGIDVRLNGKPIGPLGPRGQVRTVRFTSENFEILPVDEPAVEPPVDPKTL
jgi:cytoskeleton protein RodZ